MPCNIIGDMDKAEARKLYKNIRKAVDHKDSKSLIIAKRVLELVEDKNCIAIYYPIKDEVDTKPIIEALLSTNKKVALPATTKDGMEFYAIESLNCLKNGEIYDYLKEPDPEKTQKVSPKDIDVIICPGLAFDKQGHRLGYGGGYYDKYLENLACFKIGVCCKELLVDAIPFEEHDSLMDIVLTD